MTPRPRDRLDDYMDSLYGMMWDTPESHRLAPRRAQGREPPPTSELSRIPSRREEREAPPAVPPELAWWQDQERHPPEAGTRPPPPGEPRLRSSDRDASSGNGPLAWIPGLILVGLIAAGCYVVYCAVQANWEDVLMLGLSLLRGALTLLLIFVAALAILARLPAGESCSDDDPGNSFPMY